MFDLFLPSFSHAYGFRSEFEDFLLFASQNAASSQARGVALYRLATGYLHIAEMLSFIKVNDASADEYLDIDSPHAVHAVGYQQVRSYVSRFFSAEPQEMFDLAVSAAARARDNFGGERIYDTRLGPNNTLIRRLYSTVRRAADCLIYRLTNVRIGRRLPSIRLETLVGDSILPLANAIGRMPSLLCFWSTKCGPCLNRVESFDQLTGALGTGSVDIVLINVDSKKDSLVRFVEENPNSAARFSCYVSPKLDIQRRWGINGIPSILLVDGGGILKARGMNIPDENIIPIINRLT